MKNSIKLFVIMGLFLLAGIPETKAQISFSVGLRFAPAWAPVEYAHHTRYYYIPDLDCYYDAYLGGYYFHDEDGDDWFFTQTLPGYCQGFNFYACPKVELEYFGNRPFDYFRDRRLGYFEQYHPDGRIGYVQNYYRGQDWDRDHRRDWDRDQVRNWDRDQRRGWGGEQRVDLGREDRRDGNHNENHNDGGQWNNRAQENHYAQPRNYTQPQTFNQNSYQNQGSYNSSVGNRNNGNNQPASQNQRGSWGNNDRNAFRTAPENRNNQAPQLDRNHEGFRRGFSRNSFN